MSEDPLALARAVVRRARSKEDLEAFALHSTDTRIAVHGGELDSLSSAGSRGVGVRVIDQGRLGYAYTAEVTEAGLDDVVEQARANAVLSTPDEANLLPGSSPAPDVGGLVDGSFDEVSVEEKLELALELEATALAHEDVRTCGMVRYADSITRAAIASTNGVEREVERTDAWAFAQAIATREGSSQTGMGLTLGGGPRSLDVVAAGTEAAGRAARLLGARKPASGPTTVVFDPYVAAQFLGVLAGALGADAVLKGRSMFADRIGDAVGAPIVTLVDDGLREGAPGTSPWDGEGVPQQRTELIAGGTLQTFLHDTWTAARTGGGIASTGNASRSGYASLPSLAPTNLYLEPGGASGESVIRGVAEGVYVQDVMGLHSGANPISGQFSVSFSGLMIRDGEFAEPIAEAAVSSTIPDILRGIEAVGSDLRFYPFGGSLGGSTLRIREMSVSGG